MAAAKNFPINKVQLFRLSYIAGWCEGGYAGEVVINGESYDEEFESFKFAIRVKDEAPNSVWDSLLVNADGWSFFGMYKDGSVKQLEGP